MSTSAYSPTKACVLVVEDSVELQRYLRLMLELDHYQVEIAGNGEEALRHMQNGLSAKVVLLDMQMPGIDGLETLRNLRQRYPKVRVIMCSGVDDPEKVRQAISLGAFAYLVKPVKHLYLSAAIERCLAEEPGGMGAPRLSALSPHLVCRPN